MPKTEKIHRKGATLSQSQDSIRINPHPLAEVHHFIPESALSSSEEVKHPPKGRRQAKPDPYSEERVSRDYPSKREVRISAPDDTMNPG